MIFLIICLSAVTVVLYKYMAILKSLEELIKSNTQVPAPAQQQAPATDQPQAPLSFTCKIKNFLLNITQIDNATLLIENTYGSRVFKGELDITKFTKGINNPSFEFVKELFIKRTKTITMDKNIHIKFTKAKGLKLPKMEVILTPEIIKNKYGIIQFMWFGNTLFIFKNTTEEKTETIINSLKEYLIESGDDKKDVEQALTIKIPDDDSDNISDYYIPSVKTLIAFMGNEYGMYVRFNQSHFNFTDETDDYLLTFEGTDDNIFVNDIFYSHEDDIMPDINNNKEAHHFEVSKYTTIKEPLVVVYGIE